jgi:hypothetical protein
LDASPSDAPDRAAGGQPDRAHVVVEDHSVAELAAQQRLARDGEGDLAGARVAEAARAQRDLVVGGHAVDVALVHDAAVRVQEVERDRGPAPLPRARAVERRRGRAVAVAQRREPVEQPRTEGVDAGVDRVDADAVEKAEADLDGRQVEVIERAVLEVRGPGREVEVLALHERGDDGAAREPRTL